MISFEKQTWYDKNDPNNQDKRIPISATHLNRIENAISAIIGFTNSAEKHWWKVYKVVEGTEDVYKEIGYVSSFDKYGYKDGDGYVYEYIGIPSVNLIQCTKIETGSYIGTGTVGVENPCSLTFSAPPKIWGVSSHSDGDSLVVIGDVSYAEAYFGTNYAQLSINTKGNNVSWYSVKSTFCSGTKAENTPAKQFNTAGETYHYFAIYNHSLKEY